MMTPAAATPLLSTSFLALLMATTAFAAPEGLQPLSDMPSVLIEEGEKPVFGAVFASKSRLVTADGRVLDLEFVSEDIEDPRSDAMGDTAAFQRFTVKNPAVLEGDARLCDGKARLMTASMGDKDPREFWIEFYDIPSFDQMAQMTQPCGEDGFRFNQVAVVGGPSVSAGPASAAGTPGDKPSVPASAMSALDAAYVAAVAAAPAIDIPEPPAEAEPAPDPGKWIKSIDTNPLDDTKTVVLQLTADEGRSTRGQPITLIARCKSNKTELYINWNDFLGDDSYDVYRDMKYVQVRLGQQKASMQEWGISTDKNATFAPGWAGDLLKAMVKEERMVVSTTPYSENPVTAIFDLRGLEHPLRELAQTCSWSF